MKEGRREGEERRQRDCASEKSGFIVRSSLSWVPRYILVCVFASISYRSGSDCEDKRAPV